MVKIGVRPTIDGREKGIRESLEEQTIDVYKRQSLEWVKIL